MKATSPKKKLPAKAEVKENTFPVVAICASAGGLEAMMELLKYLPADTGMAFIYVQHLSPDHKSMLTEILSKKTKMNVQEIDDMDKIKPDNVFVIPYNKGIEVTDGHIKLIPRSETSAAISIDILFSSLAEAQNERVIGIILSGSASDGTQGMKTIKQHGGLTFAQDDTAKFQSMPHSAIAEGMVDYILSPKEIALELGRLSKHPLIKTIGVKNGEEDLIENSNPDLKIILNQLHKVTRVDFSVYKMSTIKRRIIRRMLLYKITTLKEYAKLLSQKKEEIDILYQDLLINVTSFFRDTETHKYLKETLFPKLLKRKKTGEPLRIWVPACATGEEAYSLAMMLIEIQESKTTNIPVQIFATDLSEQAISKARIGVYTKQDLETVSPKRIQRFFTKADGSFRVNKVLRDMCVFAPHNILQDPPFSRLDFISCCNLFIYFDIAAQKKVVNTFHYALNEDGFLMLGKSENISHSTKLFTAFNNKYKIFSRKLNSGTRTLPALIPRYTQQIITENNKSVTNITKTKQNISINHSGLDNAIDAVLVSEFMPASVVINHQMEIVQFRGTTDLYLTHPKGKATFNILKMARPEMAFELRNALSKVIKTKHRIRKSGIELKINSAIRIISLEIVPLKIEWNEPLLLILFTEQEQSDQTHIGTTQAEGRKNVSLAKDRKIKKLELELAAAHADALAIAQEHEAFTEELQSANEEVVSSNEELQTVNEELETSKEEIESANEELTTTNQELQTRNDLLNEAYGYSEAVFETIHEPMIVLDKNLRVKSANKTFYKIFKVNEEETEGVLLYDLGNKQWNIPRLKELFENILPSNSHFHDFEITHTFPSIGEKTMLLNARRIIQKMNHEELILLAIADITDRTQAEKNRALLATIVESSYDAIISITLNGTITSWNNGAEKIFGYLTEQAIGKNISMVIPLELKHEEDMVFGKILKGETVLHYDTIRLTKDGSKVNTSITVSPITDKDGKIIGASKIARDITEQVLAHKKVEESEFRYYNMIHTSPSLICILKGEDMIIEIANDAIIKSWGKGSDIIGKSLYKVIPETEEQGFDKLLLSVYKTGEPVFAYESPITLLRNGKLELMHYTFVYQAQRNVDGEIEGVAILANEVSVQVEAQNKLKESEERLQKTMAHFEIATTAAEIGTWSLNLASQTLEWSDLHKKMWGFDEQRTDLIYEDWHKAILAEDKEAAFAQVDKALTTNTLYETSYRIKRVDNGEIFWIRSLGKYLYNDAGEAINLSGVSIDITKQKNAEINLRESENRFRSLADNAPLNVFIIEPTADAQISYWNKYWLDYTGQTLEEALDKAWDGIVHPDDVNPIMDVYVPAFEARKPYHLPGIRLKRHDGEYRWFAVQANPRFLPNGEFIGYIGVGFDVNEQKLFETELIAAKVHAENVTKSKQQFLSNMSHEIRTPLNSILGFTNVLLKTELVADQKEFVQAIKTSGKSLNVLINDILDLAKVDAGRMTFIKQPFEIFESITSILHTFDLKIKEKNLDFVKEFDRQIPTMLLGDSVRLNQIILNLMSNAIKFTHKGEISLSVKLLNEDEENVAIEFTVSDSGIGIAANKINSIFKIFEQAEISTSNSYGGTGLGLAIVKQLIEAQGGSINLRSELGKGSTFSFILSFEKTNVKSEDEIEIFKLDSEIKTLRILVVEDVALNQLLIKIILNDFGFEYEIVSNGKIAIEKLASASLSNQSYDIILMDLQMPEMNGFEATEYIRKTMKSKIPIIALTADVTTADVSKCKEFGMDDYISKPINEKSLYNKIVGLIKNKP